jgi:hypothetical protein
MIPATYQTEWAVAVGSSAVLGGIIVLLIIALIILLVTCYQMVRDEYQFRRQCDQYYGKRNENPRKPGDATRGNFGELGSQDKNLGLVAGNVSGHCVHNPGIFRKLGNRLAMLLNLLLNLLGLAHTRMTPNDPKLSHGAGNKQPPAQGGGQ